MTAINCISVETEKLKGDFEIKEKPKVVGDNNTKIQELYTM